MKKKNGYPGHTCRIYIYDLFGYNDIYNDNRANNSCYCWKSGSPLFIRDQVF